MSLVFRQPIRDLYQNPTNYRSILFILANDQQRLLDFNEGLIAYLNTTDTLASLEEIQIFMDVQDLIFEIDNPSRPISEFIDRLIQRSLRENEYPNEILTDRSPSPLQDWNPISGE